jgi:hypothetical protein
MGKLTEKCRKAWKDFKDSCNAADDLKAALKNHDAAAAVLAVSHAVPDINPYEDKILRNIAAYAGSKDCDKAVLNDVREAVYSHYDAKLRRRFDLFSVEEKTRPAAGYRNADCVYAMAAYMNDAKKLAVLGRAGITPDEVSNDVVSENIVMGAARRGCFAAMKEVIRQGASLDKVFGFDEFPPMHAFSKPLFHAFHPGVTEALVQTGKTEILHTVAKVIGEEKLMEIEKRCGGHPPSASFHLPHRA